MAKEEKKKKESKRKPKYGMFSCVAYVYRLLWSTERSLVFNAILTVPIWLILAVHGLVLPSIVIAMLEKSDRFTPIVLVIIGLLIFKLIVDVINNVIDEKIAVSKYLMQTRLRYMLEKKQREQDWYQHYDTELRKLNQRADNAAQLHGDCFPVEFANLLAQLLKFLLYGSVVSMLHPVIILLLVAGCAVNYWMNKWYREKNYSDQDVRNELVMKICYCTFRLSRNFKYAKDIRLYNMKESMHKRLDWLFAESDREQKKVIRRSFLTSFVSQLVILCRDGAAYAFLIWKAVQGEIDASSFILYFSAITSMAGMMGDLLGIVSRVQEGALEISDFREAMETEGKLNHGEGIPVPNAPFSIEFRNVSYQYPEGEKKVLDNVSFKIEAGEKIALVGLNGAGKTTLTMLMCGLLLPDEGEILLDGHTLFEYNRDEMYSLFGFVPQDYHLLPVSIARNIASAMTDDEIDREKLNRCVEMAGLTEKIASLPLGLETPLTRVIHKDGVELSGGEAQKLLLSRLLYKNPLCIILDEPTAALDPIAEDRMYRRYNEISANSTSVFISHRLASTRFCDRIFLIDGANFAEVGTHDELMAAGGKYRELFDI